MNFFNNGKIRGKTLDAPPTSHALIADGVEYPFEIIDNPNRIGTRLPECLGCRDAYNSDGTYIPAFKFTAGNRNLYLMVCNRCKDNSDLPFEIYRALYLSRLVFAKIYHSPKDAYIRWMVPRKKPISL